MTQREKFFETVGILVEAYLNDTLVHGDPCGCGFGNLVAKKLGAKVMIELNQYDLEKSAKWVSNRSGHRAYNWYEFLRAQGFLNQLDNASGRYQVYMTGYAIDEAIRIERAFESVVTWTGRDFTEDPDGYKGLMAVVDELASIHSIDLSERESAKLLFKKESV